MTLSGLPGYEIVDRWYDIVVRSIDRVAAESCIGSVVFLGRSLIRWELLQSGCSVTQRLLLFVLQPHPTRDGIDCCACQVQREALAFGICRSS